MLEHGCPNRFLDFVVVEIVEWYSQNSIITEFNVIINR